MGPSQRHIFLSDIKESLSFTSNASGGKVLIPERDRETHSRRLYDRFENIWAAVAEDRAQRQAISIRGREGTYLEFRSSQGFALTTKSLEDVRQDIRLLNVRQVGEGDGQETLCTVYIPAGKESVFLQKVRDYTDPTKNTPLGNPKNQTLINSIEDVRLALVESLWTDPINLLPSDNPEWCEVWLRHSNTDAQHVVETFINLLTAAEIAFKEGYLIFPERAVLLVRANRIQLSELLAQTDSLAEIRYAQEAAGFWVSETNAEQQAWVQDLVSRLNVADNINVRICILDSGVNNGHGLLSPILEDENCLTVRPTWNTNDHYSGYGHGTLMSGIAAYNSLEELLLSTASVDISHKLCSVKILPPPHIDETPIELWGDITAQAVSRAEINLPNDRIVYCMAVTSSRDIDRGRPSSWSGAIDTIAFGEADNKRLIIISAGNVDDEDIWREYPDGNLLCSVHNPAQSWNSLVVGAYTEKIFSGGGAASPWNPIAASGCLSPFSSTSALWERKWPVKPDVVFEGGNILLNDDGTFDERHEDLSLLSTSKLPLIRQFGTINATSAAAAKASWMAAKIMVEYPDAWPETIRGLMIHSAEWREEMFAQFGKTRSKNDIKDMLRIFGYGVPNPDKALHSYENSLTFVSQDTIQPFIKESGLYKTNEMHLFELPWPREELLANPDISVTLKVTLSYFIEPGVGEVGWKDKYRYRSHGLCFDVNSETESREEFEKRINKAAREEDEEIDSDSGSSRWMIGMKGRKFGSVHSDTWVGTAAQLADCNFIGIFPIIGWWRERTHLGRVNTETRYSLIVTLETPAQDVQLYTPVSTLIATPIAVASS